MIIYLLPYDEKCARRGKNTIEKILRRVFEQKSTKKIFNLEISELVISFIRQKTKGPIG